MVQAKPRFRAAQPNLRIPAAHRGEFARLYNMRATPKSRKEELAPQITENWCMSSNAQFSIINNLGE